MVYFRLENRISSADVGSRVVVRWRRPSAGAGGEVADVLGVLEAADNENFCIRKASGEVVTIPVVKVLAAKPVPPPPSKPRPSPPGEGTPQAQPRR